MIDEIIKGIWDDINDRKGFHLDSLDEDIQDEIKQNWRDILENIFTDQAHLDSIREARK